MESASSGMGSARASGTVREVRYNKSMAHKVPASLSRDNTTAGLKALMLANERLRSSTGPSLIVERDTVFIWATREIYPGLRMSQCTWW